MFRKPNSTKAITSEEIFKTIDAELDIEIDLKPKVQKSIKFIDDKFILFSINNNKFNFLTNEKNQFVVVETFKDELKTTKCHNFNITHAKLIGNIKDNIKSFDSISINILDYIKTLVLFFNRSLVFRLSETLLIQKRINTKFSKKVVFANISNIFQHKKIFGNSKF